MAALRVAEDERAWLRSPEHEVELSKLHGDRAKEFRRASARALRCGHVPFGEPARDTESVARKAALEHVAPMQRERFARPEAFVGEDTDESRIGAPELLCGWTLRARDDGGADRFDLLGRARVDGGAANVPEPDRPRGRVRRQPPPLDRAPEYALQDRKRAVDRRRAGARGAQLRSVLVDRLA